MKKLTDYLPVNEELVLIQGKVPKDVVLSVRKILTERHLSWNDLLTASLTFFMIENEREKTEKKRSLIQAQ